MAEAVVLRVDKVVDRVEVRVAHLRVDVKAELAAEKVDQAGKAESVLAVPSSLVSIS